MIEVADLMLETWLREVFPGADYDLSFEMPLPSWSSGLQKDRQTINAYLCQILENTELRKPGWDIRKNPDQTVTSSKYPPRVDLYYLVTAWGPGAQNTATSEHKMLGLLLAQTLRESRIPAALIPVELANGDPTLEVPVSLTVSPAFLGHGTSHFWQSLGQGLKPSLTLRVTIPINLQKEFTGPMVVTRTIRYPQASEETLQIGGIVARGGASPGVVPGALVRLYDNSRALVSEDSTDNSGRFSFGGLKDGAYVVEATAEGCKKKNVRVQSLEQSKLADLAITLDCTGG